MLPMRDDNEQRTTEDRATQPMEAGGWVSQFEFKVYSHQPVTNRSEVLISFLTSVFSPTKFGQFPPET